MKKFIKTILKILLILLAISLLFVLVNFIIHKVKYKQEYNFLDELGYVNKYSAGDYDLNIYQTGNKNSEYTIIGMSGLSVNDYSIEMKYAIEDLDYNFVFFIIKNINT